ncbi:MAG: methyl-accepting chemotaxis protein [Acidobacteriota bacterium]
MLKNLRFKHKIMLLPFLATGTFLLILTITQILGARNAALLIQIEAGYAPAVELSRDLVEKLAAIQRALQDAVAAADNDGLSEADALQEAFLKRLNEGASNTLIESGRLDYIKTSFQDYYGLARETSAKMINKETGEELTTRLESMQSKYKSLKEHLDLKASSDKAAMVTAFASARNINQTSLLIIAAITLICILLMGLVSVWIIRGVIKPLGDVSSGCARMSVGDFTTKIAVSNHDEIGALGRQINSMVAYLRNMALLSDNIASGDLTVQVEPLSAQDSFGNSFSKMVRALCLTVAKVRRSAEKVRGISINLAASGQQLERDSETVVGAVQDTAATIEELSHNVHSIANNIESQSSSITETSVTVQQISNQMQGITKNTNQLTLLAKGARGVVGDGRQAVEKAADSMREINVAISTTATTIQEFGEHAATIGRIVEVINAISDQTNLLALNAAIEAARAGDHGLGFGVVAEEVRKLSERTAKSADEISILISGLEKGVGQVTKQMKRSTELVREGLDLSDNTVGTLNKIDTVVSQVAQTSIDIDNIIVEQSAGTQQLQEAVQDILVITQEIQAASQEQATSTGEIVKAVNRIREAAERNAKVAEQLSSMGCEILSQSEHLEEAINAFHLSNNMAVLDEFDNSLPPIATQIVPKSIAQNQPI